MTPKGKLNVNQKNSSYNKPITCTIYEEAKGKCGSRIKAGFFKYFLLIFQHK